MNIHERINKTWIDRWNQRIERAALALGEIQSLAGWPDLSLETLQALTADPSQMDLCVQALMLKSSLLRAQGHRRESSALLQKVTRYLERQGLDLNFFCRFELGIDHWIDFDLAPALDRFLMAERQAPHRVAKAFAAANVLWCLESMDLPRDEMEDRVRNLIAMISADKTESEDIKHVQEQWQAYLLRKQFYKDLTFGTESTADVASTAYSGQAEFFIKWAHALPFVKGHLDSSQQKAIDPAPLYLWQGSFRNRTLQGIWVPSDKSVVRVSDAIDRLYLWVWYWMAKKSFMTQQKVVLALDAVIDNLDFKLQSQENRLLLRNALEWVAQLIPSRGRRLAKLRSSLAKIQSETYPVLDAEFFLAQRLSHSFQTTQRLPRQTSDLDELISRYEAFGRILHQTLAAQPVAGLVAPLLREHHQRRMEKVKDDSILVDLDHGEVRVMRQETLVRSGPMARLLAAVELRECVGFEEVFGPEATAQAANNLVARARRLLSPRSLVVRDFKIARGPEWPGVQVLSGEDLVSQIGGIQSIKQDKSSSSSRGVLAAGEASLPESEVHLQAARALLADGFSRKDLEMKLCVSKATACRVLEAWLATNEISRVGRAKAVRYLWNQNAKPGSENHDVSV